MLSLFRWGQEEGAESNHEAAVEGVPATTTTTEEATAAERQETKFASSTDELDAAGGPTHDESSSSNTPQQQQGSNGDDENHEANTKLYKSRRFKGYLTIALASVINYNAAVLSTSPINVTSVPASKVQQSYALVVAMTSAVVMGLLVLIHLDHYTPLRHVWQRLFAPSSSEKKCPLELLLLLFLTLWWSVATIIQTTVRGLAGDGKEQYNLYFSTWVCLWTAFWTLEHLVMDLHGFPSAWKFVRSWPRRAPGWILIFASSFVTVFSYVDLFVNTVQNPYRVSDSLKPFFENISKGQYQALLFLSALTLVPSGIFVFAEILRGDSSTSSKGDGGTTIADHPGTTRPQGNVELTLEGCCLALLTLMWIPSVVVATGPGGFASLVGNAYFSTWMTAIVVMDTFLLFIKDFRGSVHAALEAKEKEYRQHQSNVMAKSNRAIMKNSSSGTIPDNHSDNGNPVQPGDSDHHDADNNDDYDEMYGYHKPDDSVSSPIRFASSDQRVLERDEEESKREEGDDDNSILRELELKNTNSQEYFDNLIDIME